jgi:predicted acetyltransferase
MRLFADQGGTVTRLRALGADEAAEAARMAAVSMGGADDETLERVRRRIAAGTLWGLERDGKLVGQCLLLPTDHWFGGRRVRCLDVAGVSVPPEHRGQGVARAMMDAAARHGRDEGYGLSLLFPATTGMYRKLGWELAGTWTKHQLAPRQVPPQGPVMRAADRDTDWAAIRDCHTRSARLLSGPSERSADRWTLLAETPYRYVLDAAGQPGTVDAYALVRQEALPDDWQHGLHLEDWAATTPEGLRAVVGLVGRWSTFARRARFTDMFPSRWSAVLPEQDITTSHLHWMARGLDLEAAVAARGFPAGLASAVTLQVETAWGTEGPWRLEVADGRGRLTPAADADVRLDGRAFGPLFTGFRTARELRLHGLLQGPDAALELLEAAFAGPPPTLLDFF